MKRDLAERRLGRKVRLLALAMALLVLRAPAYSQTPGLSLALQAGHAYLCVTGLVNTGYAVQYATNLSQSNHWQVLTNLLLSTNTCTLADTSYPVAEQRFYRAMALNPLKVAVFSDPNGATMAECVTATLDILRTNAGFSASTISPGAIANGGLAGFDVVMFPGGSGGGQAQALGQIGCAKVEQFVAAGGGFIGTCAGAYLAALGYTNNPATFWLDIVDAQVIDVAHWNRGSGMASIQIVNPSHPILAGFSTNLSVQYINGPLLGPGNSPTLPDYEAEAIYLSDFHDNGAPAGVMPGTTCMTTSTYALGRCVLFSFHPELTRNLGQMDVQAVRWAARRL